MRERVQRNSNALLAKVLGMLVVCGAVASAQSPIRNNYFRRILNQDQGLPETQVNAIAQTSDGYLWLGTRRGLIRYDGLTFQSYVPRNALDFASRWVNGLTVDRRGRLWISTSHGLEVLERGLVRRISTRYVPDADTWEVLEDSDGRIWVTGAQGTHVGDGTVFHQVPGMNATGYALWSDRSGRVWVGGRRFLVATRNDSIDMSTRIPMGENRVLDMVDDGDNGFWAATRDGAMHVTMDRAGNARRDRQISTAQEGRNPVWAIARTPDGGLWLGTDGRGVLLWDGKSLTTVDPTEGLAARQAGALLLDTRGRVWAGTGAGLEKYQRSAFQTFQADRSLPRESIWAIRGTRDGSIWAAAYNRGVYRFDGDRFSIAVTPSTPGSGSVPIWPAAAGGIFVARNLRQVIRLDETEHDLSRTVQLPAADVMGIFEDPARHLWFSTDSGLYRSTGGRAMPAYTYIGLGKNDVPRVMTHDAAGRVLLGRPGLTVIDANGARRYGVAEGLTDLEVRAVYPHGRNTWIGTLDSGLYVLRDDRVINLSTFDARLRSEVQGIVADNLGSLWLTSRYGLRRVPLTQLDAVLDGTAHALSIQSFDREDGLATTEFNGDYQSQLYKDSEGRLWLPSYGGVVRLDPALVAADTMTPQVHLERVLVNGVEQRTDTALTLPPQVSRLELTFAATDALVPRRVRVQYRMDGVDTGWIDSGDRRSVSYGPLRGGRYRFQIRAANQADRWSPRPLALMIDVRMQLRERRWFTALLIAVAMGLLATLNRVRRLTLVNRSRALERLVAERTSDLELARGTLEVRVDERTARLAAELSERKRLEGQLLHTQRLEGLGRLAGGVAHEINNSMTGVIGYAELAEWEVADGAKVVSSLRQIRLASERVTRITGQLLVFARMHQVSDASVRLSDVLQRQEESLRLLIGDGIHLETNVPDAVPPVRIHATQMEQLLINLVLNARDAMPTGGTIRVVAEHLTNAAPHAVGPTMLPPGDYVRLVVSDTGTGIPAEVRARMFEPFFTTKGLVRGGGLGLAVCHGIVTSQGGAIDAESTPGDTKLVVWLPVGSVTGEEQLSPMRTAPARGTETVLVVDDDPMVRRLAAGSLESLGYRVLEAADGLEALRARENSTRPVDLVLTDVMMPQMDGLALARALRDRGAVMPILFMSGFVGGEPAMEEKLAAFGVMLDKPFALEALARAVRGALNDTTR